MIADLAICSEALSGVPNLVRITRFGCVHPCAYGRIFISEK
jgi:hypothetical protein